MNTEESDDTKSFKRLIIRGLLEKYFGKSDEEHPMEITIEEIE